MNNISYIAFPKSVIIISPKLPKKRIIFIKKIDHLRPNSGRNRAAMGRAGSYAARCMYNSATYLPTYL